MDFNVYDKNGNFMWGAYFEGLTENASPREVARCFERIGLKPPRFARFRAVTCYGRVHRNYLTGRRAG